MTKFYHMWRHFGVKRTLHWIFYRSINYLIYYRCYCFFYAESPASPPETRDSIEYRFIGQAEFERVRTQDKYMINLDRVRQLYDDGFRACGVYDNGKLVSYVWINTRQKYVNTDFTVILKTSPNDWVYLIKAYTLKEARGKRYSAYLRDWLLREQNASGMLFDVESVNYPSLNTVGKHGSQQICNLRILGLGNRRWRFGGGNNRFFTVT